MAVTATQSDGGKTLTIRVDGRFDFSAHDEFRAAYADSSADRFVVDLAGLEFLDSSALGLLVLLREHAGGDAANVEILNCSTEVRRILTIASFQRLFTIV